MIPYGHTIHCSCFKSWYKHSPSDGIRCSVCERRYTTLQVPLCPLTEWYCTIARMRIYDPLFVLQELVQRLFGGKNPMLRLRKDTPLLKPSSARSQNILQEDRDDSCITRRKTVVKQIMGYLLNLHSGRCFAYTPHAGRWGV
jgi:hypothetical protein